MLEIKTKHVQSMTKIGKCENSPITLLKTYGGLYIVAMMTSGEPEILAFASHPAIAKYTAEKKHKKKITWDE